MQKKRLVSFPMFCKGHQGRPPEQEPSASFSFPASISYQLHVHGRDRCKTGFDFVPTCQQRHWLKPRLSILAECAIWILLAGREGEAVGWLVGCAWGCSRGGEGASV